PACLISHQKEHFLSQRESSQPVLPLSRSGPPISRGRGPPPSCAPILVGPSPPSRKVRGGVYAKGVGQSYRPGRLQAGPPFSNLGAPAQKARGDRPSSRHRESPNKRWHDIDIAGIATGSGSQ